MKPEQYQCIGAYNPSGIYPSTLVPVFEKSAEQEMDVRAFHQVYDQEGVITDFEPIDGVSAIDLSSTLDVQARWNQPYEVGLKRCIAYSTAFGAEKFSHFSEITEFDIEAVLNDWSLFRNPLAATIMVRQLLNSVGSNLDVKKYLYGEQMGRLVAAHALMTNVYETRSLASSISNNEKVIAFAVSKYSESQHQINGFDARIAFFLVQDFNPEFFKDFWVTISENLPTSNFVPILISVQATSTHQIDSALTGQHHDQKGSSDRDHIIWDLKDVNETKLLHGEVGKGQQKFIHNSDNFQSDSYWGKPTIQLDIGSKNKKAEIVVFAVSEGSIASLEFAKLVQELPDMALPNLNYFSM